MPLVLLTLAVGSTGLCCAAEPNNDDCASSVKSEGSSGRRTTPPENGTEGASATQTARQGTLAQARRILRQIDVDGNGTLEKAEDPAAWKRFGKWDANRDQVLTVAEIQVCQRAGLETSGRRTFNLAYKKVGPKDLLLDLYYPAQAPNQTLLPYPTVIYTHGGGWAAGSKEGITKSSFRAVFEQLLQRGFAVASVDYRLCRKNSGVTIRDCVIDSKDAVRYLAKHSKTLALDADRFFVMGDSAGGHIAQMLLLTSPQTLPGDPQLATATYTLVAGVSWYGPCDFEKTNLFNHDDRANFRDRFESRILGFNPDPDSRLDRYREVSPVNYLKKDSPPLLMIQGDQDTTIPVRHAWYMQEKAHAVKAQVEIMIIKNAGHNWRKVEHDIAPPRETIIERTVQFFVDHLPKQ